MQKKGAHFLILEASDHATGSWSNHYDSLKLFSPARFSSLPGMELLGDKERYPFKNEVIQYFKDYSKQFKLPVRTKQHVSYVEKPNEVIKIYTVSGEEARQKGASTDKQMLLLFHEEFG